MSLRPWWAKLNLESIKCSLGTTTLGSCPISKPCTTNLNLLVCLLENEKYMLLIQLTICSDTSLTLASLLLTLMTGKTRVWSHSISLAQNPLMISLGLFIWKLKIRGVTEWIFAVCGGLAAKSLNTRSPKFCSKVKSGNRSRNIEEQCLPMQYQIVNNSWCKKLLSAPKWSAELYSCLSPALW